MDYQKILDEIYKEIKPHLGKGKVADYIPELAKANPKDFAMSLVTLDGESYHVGLHQKRFSIQSISKLFTFTMALKIYSTKLYERVGVEPSGNPFNSLVQLEYEHGKPRNPFINAGALVITDSLIRHYQDEFITLEHILNFLRSLSHTPDININPSVAKSELDHGFRNRALANLIKDFGNLDNDPLTVVETYSKQCAVEMSSEELARSMLFLANRGVDPISKREYVTPTQAKRINAVMLTCGHYDASGEFAFHVGLPGKSGVGGGIVAVVPGKMGICVWSPPLNRYGNSYAGTIALELFTSKTGLSIF
ncbi:MAG: glutaminase [Nitratiruptor sp.]|nr:glutaminase [Nitratiruptor sp.]NPA83739.1 glutaminase [Campylobacterota bacterium]